MTTLILNPKASKMDVAWQYELARQLKNNKRYDQQYMLDDNKTHRRSYNSYTSPWLQKS
jgi:hypothetical protein